MKYRYAGTYVPDPFKGQGWYLLLEDEIVGGPFADWTDVTSEMMNQTAWGLLQRVYLDSSGKVIIYS